MLHMVRQCLENESEVHKLFPKSPPPFHFTGLKLWDINWNSRVKKISLTKKLMDEK